MKHEDQSTITIHQPDSRVAVSIYVAPMTLAILEKMQSAGMDTGREIDDMFIAFAESLGWMKYDEEGNPVELLR